MPDNTIMLTDYIRDIPDFPREGILFKDITPLLAHPEGFTAAIAAICEPFAGERIDYVAAVEARGFIFGSVVAKQLGTGFIPIRKSGKLPHYTEAVTYDLEYGTDTIEVHRDAIEAGAHVLMVDDLLATGGTMVAACKLIEQLGGKIIGFTCLIELTVLEGRKRLGDYPIHSVISY